VNTTAILLLVLIGVVIAAGAVLVWQRRRSAELQKRFGPECQRAVSQFGDQQKAEAELASRQKRVRRMVSAVSRALMGQVPLKKWPGTWKNVREHRESQPTSICASHCNVTARSSTAC
jgi:sensor domain CHASE-containing protein